MLKRFLILSLVLTACDGGENPEPSDGIDSGTERTSLIEGRECPPDNTTTYTNTGGPILISWCITCHSSHVPADQRQRATVGVNFDTVNGINEQLLRIYARAGDDNKTMPPVDSLTADERRRLGDWIACGAPGLEDAILPEPGDGTLVIDGGTMGGAGMRRDGGGTGMQRDGGGTGMQRDGGGTGSTDAGMCMEDMDCEAECAQVPMGCSCVERRTGSGVRACVRNCQDDDDCPGTTLVCVNQLCRRP
jgi:hypothetical protein